MTNFSHKAVCVPFCLQQEIPHQEPRQNPCLANSLHTAHNARVIQLWLAMFNVILWFLHHHRGSPVQINAVETDNVTCQQLILFYWWRTPWYNMDRVWFDKLAANTEPVNTYNIFSSLFVIYLRTSLTFHFSRSLIKYTKSTTRGIFHT